MKHMKQILTIVSHIINNKLMQYDTRLALDLMKRTTNSNLCTGVHGSAGDVGFSIIPKFLSDDRIELHIISNTESPDYMTMYRKAFLFSDYMRMLDVSVDMNDYIDDLIDLDVKIVISLSDLQNESTTV